MEPTPQPIVSETRADGQAPRRRYPKRVFTPEQLEAKRLRERQRRKNPEVAQYYRDYESRPERLERRRQAKKRLDQKRRGDPGYLLGVRRQRALRAIEREPGNPWRHADLILVELEICKAIEAGLIPRPEWKRPDWWKQPEIPEKKKYNPFALAHARNKWRNRTRPAS